MSDTPPPDQPGWYADAGGAWWYWDGFGWTPAPAPAYGPGAPSTPSPAQERGQTLLMWILVLVIGGWVAALIFYVIAKDEKRFLRHHAAEALNLTIVLIVPNLVSFGLMMAGFFQWVSETDGQADPGLPINGLIVAGLVVSMLVSLVQYGLGIVGAVQANRGHWYRLPIGFHPVRGVLPKGAEPPYDVTG